MITEIGITAGEIWRLLEQKGQLELSEITEQPYTEKQLVLMALGWLCREGHVLLVRSGNKVFVELKQIERK